MVLAVLVLLLLCVSVSTPLEILELGEILGSKSDVECKIPFIDQKKEEFFALMDGEFDEMLKTSCGDLMLDNTLDITQTCDPSLEGGVKLTCHVIAKSQKSKALFEDVLVSILFHNEFVALLEDPLTIPGLHPDLSVYCLTMTRTQLVSQSQEESERDTRTYYEMVLNAFTFEPLRDIQKFRVVIDLMRKGPFGIILLNNTCYKQTGYLSRECIHSVRINQNLYSSDPVRLTLSKGNDMVKEFTSSPDFLLYLPLLLNCNFAKLINDIAGEAIHFFVSKWLGTFQSSVTELYMVLDEKVKTFPNLHSLDGYDLKNLVLDQNYWKTIEKEKIPKCENMESFTVTNSAMESIEEGVFDQLNTIKFMNLSNNKLKVIPSALQRLSLLETLDLSHNPIDFESSRNVLAKMTNLRTLRLSGVVLKDITPATFSGLDFAPNLRYLDLSRCRVSRVEEESLKGFVSLQTLDLSHNRLEALTGGGFQHLSRLQRLDLSDNFVSQLTRDNRSSFTIEQVDLSRNRIANFLSVLSLFQNSSVIQVSGNKIEQWDKRSIFNLSEEHCGIDSCSPLTHDPIHGKQYLQSLNLSRNRITALTHAMVNDLRLVSTVDLGGNSFDCDNCVLLDYREQFSDNASINIINFNTSEPIKCSTPRVKRGVPIRDVIVDPNLCFTNYYLVAGLPILIILVTMGLTSGLGYYYRWQLRYIFYLIRLRFEQRKDKDLRNKMCKYDAFICYSSKDEYWVAEELQETLENNLKYRLCIHQRDFIPGKLIKDNIVNAVNQSRVTVLILSDNFVSSEWCMWELNMAEHQIFSQGIIVVQLEEVEKELLPDNLRVLLESRTYIEWPTNPKGYKLFWRKLEEALGEPNFVDTVVTT